MKLSMSHEKNANVKIKIKWIMASGCKAEAFCLVLLLCWRPTGCQLPPTPPHPTPPPPAGVAPLPSLPEAGLWIGGEQFLPPPWAFSTRKVRGVTPFPKLGAITMERGNHNGILFPVQVGISEGIFSSVWVTVLANKLSGWWQKKIKSLLFLSNQFGFSSSSFRNASLGKVLVPRRREKETESEGEGERERASKHWM